MKLPIEVDNLIIIFGGAKVAALDMVKTTLKVDTRVNKASIHLQTTTDGVLVEDCPHDDLQKFKKLQAKNLELSLLLRQPMNTDASKNAFLRIIEAARVFRNFF